MCLQLGGFCAIEGVIFLRCTDEPKGVNASEVRRQLKSIPIRVSE
jgi:hypothetical protein